VSRPVRAVSCGDHSVVNPSRGGAPSACVLSFLDRVTRQQIPSPLHQHEQDITASRNAGAKEDISTLLGRGHFYFALTGRDTPLTSIIRAHKIHRKRHFSWFATVIELDV
jgi:hypothetical protein